MTVSNLGYVDRSRNGPSIELVRGNVGATEGDEEGNIAGSEDGALLGPVVGDDDVGYDVGATEGDEEGNIVGSEDGALLGPAVGDDSVGTCDICVISTNCNDHD